MNSNNHSQLRLLGRAIWHLVWIDLKGSLKYKIRVFIFYLCLLFGPMSYLIYYENINDFSMSCPAYDKLYVDDGLLSEYNNHQMHELKFVKKNGESILLHKDNTLFRTMKRKWFFDSNDNSIAIPVKLYWFVMPSGMSWIAEVEMNGQQIVSYNQRCQDLIEIQNRFKNGYIFPSIMLLFVLLMVLIEFIVLRKSAKGEK